MRDKSRKGAQNVEVQRRRDPPRLDNLLQGREISQKGARNDQKGALNEEER